VRTTLKPSAPARSSIARPIDRVDGRAGHDRPDPCPEALERDVHETSCVGIDLSDAEGLGVVAVHAAEEDRDVEVHDVAVAQRTVVGDAVAHDLVDRRAERLRVALVVQWARVAAVCDARLVADPVELVGGDARLHVPRQLEQHLARCNAGRAHAIGELAGRHRGLEGRSVGCVRRPRYRRGHGSRRRHPAGPHRRAT
jgi:hypothetical protein